MAPTKSETETTNCCSPTTLPSRYCCLLELLPTHVKSSMIVKNSNSSQNLPYCTLLPVGGRRSSTSCGLAVVVPGPRILSSSACQEPTKMHTKPSTCAIIQIQENRKKYKRKTHKAEKEGGTKVRTCYIYVFCKNKRLVLKGFACNSVQMWTLHSNLHGAIC